VTLLSFAVLEVQNLFEQYAVMVGCNGCVVILANTSPLIVAFILDEAFDVVVPSVC
jgi:hypothetical protein